MNDKAPLSPHLQVYRMPVAALASICHRLSGALLAGLLTIAVPVVLLLLAYAPAVFDTLMGICASAWFLPVHFLLILTVVYHLLSGIRHFVMDLGYWLEKDSFTLSARLLFASAAALSLILVLW